MYILMSPSSSYSSIGLLLDYIDHWLFFFIVDHLKFRTTNGVKKDIFRLFTFLITVYHLCFASKGNDSVQRSKINIRSKNHIHLQVFITPL